MENELQTQTNIKNEQEAALKLLENSLNDKHEIINILREQLEQVKSLNLDFVNDNQKHESDFKKQARELEELKESLSKYMNENLDLKKKSAPNLFIL